MTAEQKRLEDVRDKKASGRNGAPISVSGKWRAVGDDRASRAMRGTTSVTTTHAHELTSELVNSIARPRNTKESRSLREVYDHVKRTYLFIFIHAV